MSDFISELPIRTNLPSQVNYDDAIFKLGDATNPTTQLAAVDTFGSQASLIKDASGNAVTTVTNGSVQALEVQAQTAGPVSPGTAAAFSDLAGGQYNSALPTLTAGQQAALQVDSSGRLWSNVTNLPSAVDTNWGVVGASTIRTAAEIGNATGAADFNFGAGTAQTLRTAAIIGNATGAADWAYGAVDAQTLRTASQIGNATGAADFNYGTIGAQSLRVASQIGNATGAADFNNGLPGAQTLRVAAQLAVGGANVSLSNPVPVTVTSVGGTPVNDYKTVAALAGGATDNHDYTITTGKTFNGRMFWAAGSSIIKAEVQISPDGTTFTSKWVGFNSTANPNIEIQLDNLIVPESGTGSKIRVIITNRDNKAQDVYSTISGTEQ